MKIVLFGATGNVGRRVAAEVLSRGHEVVGVVRDPAAGAASDARVRLVKGDATNEDSVAESVRGADAVVSAISPRPNGRGLAAPSLVQNARAIIAGLGRTGVKRVLFVGGAGSLEVAPGQLLVDQPGFPEVYKAEALEGREALEVWRAEGGGLDWSFLSPAAEIASGERTGRYRTTGDQFLVDAAGRSFITFEDYAVAVLDELERPRHIGRRFGVPTEYRKEEPHHEATSPPAVVTVTLFALLIGVRTGSATMPAREAAGKTEPCSQACLANVMTEFKASVLAKGLVRLTGTAEVRENMEVTTVEKSAWKDVKAVKSSAVFSDAVTGNVVSRDGVEMSDGKAAYISTRLKVEAGGITGSSSARMSPAPIPPTS